MQSNGRNQLRVTQREYRRHAGARRNAGGIGSRCIELMPRLQLSDHLGEQPGVT